MLLLAIDPGVTTGVALLEADGHVLSAYEVTGSPEEIVRVIAEDITSTRVVIEKGPEGRSNRFLDELDACLRLTYPDADWMYPGEWKGTPRSEDPLPDISSRHARDAVRMGRECLHRSEVDA